MGVDADRREYTCTNMSNLTSATADEYGDGEFAYCDRIPLPQLIGAEREVKYSIADNRRFYNAGLSD